MGIRRGKLIENILPSIVTKSHSKYNTILAIRLVFFMIQHNYKIAKKIFFFIKYLLLLIDFNESKFQTNAPLWFIEGDRQLIPIKKH